MPTSRPLLCAGALLALAVPLDAQTVLDPTPQSGNAWRVAWVKGAEPRDIEEIERDGETWYRCGPCVVRTPLPVGYPRPTPPGAIEIKRYPSVRRAEIDGSGGRDDGMRGGATTGAFWPLFLHIKNRDIAMTAPVEFAYRGVDPAAGEEPGWSMSFLYRTPDLGPTGDDGDIRVYDSPPVTVVSLGLRGDMSQRDLEESVAILRDWIMSQDEWVSAGDVRSMGYNGPQQPPQDRWFEVQVPIALLEVTD